MTRRILLLGANDANTRIVFNCIHKHFPISCAIIETKKDKRQLIKKRIKRLGVFTVLGQLAFRILIVTLLNRLSKRRLTEIRQVNNLVEEPIPMEVKFIVGTVNDDESIQKIKEINPELIIVNGTRIISKNVLRQLTCPILNIHVGITPQYRGVHGMYWALTQNDSKNAGVTIHRIDEGIDTGSVLRQSTVSYTRKDNFVTYPLLQFAEGLKLYIKVIEDFFNGSLEDIKKDEVSRIWSHPTIFQYLYYFFLKGIK